MASLDLCFFLEKNPELMKFRDMAVDVSQDTRECLELARRAVQQRGGGDELWMTSSQ